MKTLKTLTAALLIIFTSSAFANDNDDTKKSEKLLMDYTIKRYINAISPEDLNLYALVDTAEEAAEQIFTFYNKYVLKPNF